MTTTINQYAERVYAEHPIALWSLDETAYYLALANDNSRLFSNWSLTECTSDDSPDLTGIPVSPFKNSAIYSSITKTTSSAGSIRALSPMLFGPSDINTSVKTFCVNFFLYQKPTYINYFQIGITYWNSLGIQKEVWFDETPPPINESWANFNQIFDIPFSWSGDLQLMIKVDFKDGADVSARTLILNGLSIGQGSETTCYENLGSEAITLPSSTNIVGLSGIPADQYGILSDNAYYLVRENNLLAYNDGFPIIFGTGSSTKLYPSGVNLPSLIFPGKGMLNEAGRNKKYTLEAWIQIDPKTTSAIKILGPLSGTDGIYVKEGFITLVVGDNISSHCVSEWYRPMLIHIQIKDNNVVLLINGEEVANVLIDKKTINLPNDTDWWGVYSYPSINMFKIDAISIYPYIVSAIAAKRRFVYGQGTPAIQSINNGFSGTAVTIDFSTAEYSSNIIYPDIARWDAGYFNNLNATKDYISVPDYTLPEININGRDIQEWYRDNRVVYGLEYPLNNSPNFITFRPNITYDIDGNPISWSTEGINYTSDEQSYLNFPSLNVLNDPVSTIYGIFEAEQNLTIGRTLMSFVNITNGETFEITITFDPDTELNLIKYFINNTELESARQSVTTGIECLVGINIEALGIEFGYEVSKFFSSPTSIQLFVGGNGNNTFEGKIYLVGFSNQTNYNEISTNFLSNGTAINDRYELLFDHIASYTLIPELEYGHLFLDISVSSSWEEYFPLTYFASYVKDENGNPYYDLDMLQINLGYVSVESNVVWTYQELRDAYVGQTYQDLKDSIYSNYFNLSKNNTTGNSVNISNSSLQSYMTFQSLSDGANSPISDFPYTKELISSKVIDPDLENTELFPQRAYETKFSFNDNVIVYPPKTNNFEDYALVVHFQINQRSILKNPLKVKSFEITSKNLNYASITNPKTQRNYVGTKFGTKINPEIDIFGVLDGKSKNPYLIYKTATPYIYKTGKSGIRVINQSSISLETLDQYQVSIPVNSNSSYDFKVAALTFFLMGNIADGSDQIPLIEIKHKDGIITLVLNKTETETNIKVYSRAINTFVNGGYSDTVLWTDYWDCGTSSTLPNVFIDVSVGSLDQTNIPDNYVEIDGVSFYQNGRYVKNPSIKNDEWNSIGLSFAEELNFDGYPDGNIKIFGGFTFNDISYYLSEGMGIQRDINARTWQKVLDSDYAGDPIIPDNLWSYWSAEDRKWQSVYELSKSSSYLSTPANIYQAYTGTNRYIIDDNSGIELNQTQTSVLTDVSWSAYTGKPV